MSLLHPIQSLDLLSRYYLQIIACSGSLTPIYIFQQVHQLQPLSLQTPSFPISRSLKTPKSFMLPGEKDAYRPCHHPNQIDCVPCNPKCEYTLTDVNPELVCDDPKHCHCVERGNWCDVNCDCSPDCALFSLFTRDS